MAISLSTLMDEAKCLCAADASDAQKATLALLQRIAEATAEQAGQPLVYRALLTQEGTNAPVATVLENTLGGTPVWTRIAGPRYEITLLGAFPQLKTFWQTMYDTTANAAFAFDRISSNVLRTSITIADDDLADPNFPACVEILVYP